MVVTKGRTYLNKPAAFSRRFFKKNMYDLSLPPGNLFQCLPVFYNIWEIAIKHWLEIGSCINNYSFDLGSLNFIFIIYRSIIFLYVTKLLFQ